MSDEYVYKVYTGWRSKPELCRAKVVKRTPKLLHIDGVGKGYPGLAFRCRNQIRFGSTAYESLCWSPEEAWEKAIRDKKGRAEQMRQDAAKLDGEAAWMEERRDDPPRSKDDW